MSDFAKNKKKNLAYASRLDIGNGGISQLHYKIVVYFLIPFKISLLARTICIFFCMKKGGFYNQFQLSMSFPL